MKATKKNVKETVQEVKAAAKTVAAKTEEVVKEEAKKADAVVKETVKKADEAAKETVKTTAKKAATKRTAAKKAVVTETVYLQYMGKEISKDDLVQQVKADWAVDHKEADIKSINLYLKPEDNAAYYVVNDSFSGKIDL